MIYLRNFNSCDAKELKRYYAGETAESIVKMISEWNTKIHDGKYFEMFAVINDDAIVGTMSLYQHTSDAVSVGPEIFAPFRRQGFAYQGMTLALRSASANGYKIAVAQVRKNNSASIALHKKAGFEIDHDFINRHGNDCFFFIRSISG